MVKDGKEKALIPEEKKYIVLLRNYFERNRHEFVTKEPSSQRVADALEVGLATMKNNRLGLEEETVRPEVYLDESYINKNHSNDYIWYST